MIRILVDEPEAAVHHGQPEDCGRGRPRLISNGRPCPVNGVKLDEGTVVVPDVEVVELSVLAKEHCEDCIEGLVVRDLFGAYGRELLQHLQGAQDLLELPIHPLRCVFCDPVDEGQGGGTGDRLRAVEAQEDEGKADTQHDGNKKRRDRELEPNPGAGRFSRRRFPDLQADILKGNVAHPAPPWELGQSNMPFDAEISRGLCTLAPEQCGVELEWLPPGDRLCEGPYDMAL